jgi:hypothetical protein
LKAFTLHDFGGLFGGQALWVAEDRTATLQFVGEPPTGQSGLWEKRYRTKLSQEQWAEVERLVGAHHFLALKVPERPGVPEERHPTIVLRTRAGATAMAQKWAGDRHAEFDPLYGYLRTLGWADAKLVREGRWDMDWRPDGFADWWE